MPRACVIDYGVNWVERLPLVQFAYNNSYHSSIGMDPFEALYGMRCRTPIGWFELSEVDMFDPNLVYQIPIEILDRKVRRLRTKDVASVKVLWWKHKVEKATWEAEEDMKSKYPFLFSSPKICSKDVMHIERNVSANVISTVMNLIRKTKDTLKNRYDLVYLGIRKGLNPIEDGDNVLLSAACCALSPEEKLKAQKRSYSVLEDIYKLSYVRNRKVYIFRCHLWDVAHSRKRYKFDMYGFTSVNTRYALNTNESFVLACQSEQVFYVDDMVDKDWLVIFKTSPCDLFNVPEKDDNNTNIEDETLTNGEAYQQENHEFNIDHIDDQENNFLMSLHRSEESEEELLDDDDDKEEDSYMEDSGLASGTCNEQRFEENEHPLHSDEILATVLGERSIYVRGKGYGKRPTKTVVCNR
ncbi:hypothetical protein T459_30440 [Capsicum annuum]|uniref:DUF4216 domain-containing protein n=1 Tax=Capsicum annuum TaxID=4072 RepID=A0A2G2Y8B8_CAPAN|nr:hypothetical protein T459_30440 [Capsicum annuum]